MLSLLAKDFKLIFARKDSISKTILSTIFSVLVIAILIAIETFIFQVILTKIKNYYQVPISFLTLFLFIISILMIVFSVIQARKLFFNKLDMEQLAIHPVSNTSVILSKLLFLFLMHYTTTLMFTYPLFVSYGLTFHKAKIFYYVTLFYPMLSFIFEVGVALIFVYPIKLLADWLKKHLIVQFALAIVIIFGLTYLYSIVLNVFINLVASNQITTIFSTEFIEKLSTIKKFFVPSYFLVEMFINSTTSFLWPFMAIAFGVFSLGLTVAVSSFKYFKNSIHSTDSLKKEHKITLISDTKALIKKEIILLFKDSGYILSFTGLLVVAPFLAYLVINALNTIFRSGAFAYYVSLLPNFVPLIDILLIMLFTLIINQGANNYISMEQKNVRLMKVIPVSAYKQLAIKVMIPFIFSSISLLASVLTLWIGNIITFQTALFGFILTFVLLAVFEIVSLFEEMKIKRNKPRSSSMSTLYSYLIPVLYFGVTVFMSYQGLDVYLVYLFGIVVILLSSIPYLVNLKKKVANLFLELEMVN